MSDRKRDEKKEKYNPNKKFVDDGKNLIIYKKKKKSKEK